MTSQETRIFISHSFALAITAVLAVLLFAGLAPYMPSQAWADETSAQTLTTEKDNTQEDTANLAGKWVKQSGYWYYKKANGKNAVGLYSPKGDTNWYYSASNGRMKTGWVKVANKWYYAKSSGALAQGWIKLKGYWYYLDPQTKAHPALTGFFSDGKVRYYTDPTSCAMKTGWIKVKNTWYYAKGSGALVSGWIKLGGKWYYLDPTQKNYPALTGAFTVAGVQYYADKNCKLITSAWVTIEGKKRWADASGAVSSIYVEKSGGKLFAKNTKGTILTGWQKLGKNWVYGDPKNGGALATGWIQPKGSTWYYMNSEGIMQEGWVKTGGKFYYLTPGSGAWNSKIPSFTERYKSVFVHGNKGAAYQKYIVLHDTEGNGTANSVIDWWASNGNYVAAHFVINKDGSVVQCVPLDKIAHHAGYGDSGHNKYYGVTDESRDDKRGTTPIGSWAADYGMNSYSVGIEMVHRGGESYPIAQLQALDRLIAYIDSYYGFESTIIDHKAWRSGNSDTSPEFAGYLANYKKYRSYKH